MFLIYSWHQPENVLRGCFYMSPSLPFPPSRLQLQLHIIHRFTLHGSPSLPSRLPIYLARSRFSLGEVSSPLPFPSLPASYKHIKRDISSSFHCSIYFTSALTACTLQYLLNNLWRVEHIRQGYIVSCIKLKYSRCREGKGREGKGTYKHPLMCSFNLISCIV